eukprot:Sspe_Gene.45592::Locus_22602_Transcript_1_1_Confidence_1.000_Length_2671::g.45592::m.45592
MVESWVEPSHPSPREVPSTGKLPGQASDSELEMSHRSGSDLVKDVQETKALRRESTMAIDDTHIPQEVSLAGTIEYLKQDVSRANLYRTMPAFCVFILLITITFGLTNTDWDESPRYYVGVGIRDSLMNNAVFQGVGSPTTFYNWLDGLGVYMFNHTIMYPEARSFHVLRSGGTGGAGGSTPSPLSQQPAPEYATHVRPLAFLLVRQRRYRTVPCVSDQSAVIAAQELTWRTCPGEGLDTSWGNKQIPTDFPHREVITDPFVPDRNKTGIPRSMSARGKYSTHDDDEEEFSIILPYGAISSQELGTIVDALERYGWIDERTSALIVQGVFYAPQPELYGTADFVVEFTPYGEVRAMASSRTFRYYLASHNALDGFIFALDLLGTLFAIVAFMDVIASLRLNYHLANKNLANTVAFFDIFALAHIGLLIAFYVYRYQRWHKGFNLPRNLKGTALFEEVQEASEIAKSSDWMFGWFFCLSWLKMFSFLRYNSRLNALTETVRLAIPELISMLVTFVIINIAVSFLAHATFGPEFDKMRTVPDTFSYLIRMLLSSDFSDYTVMKEIAPVTTPMLLIIFFFLNWVILLNLVLGALAASFSTVQENIQSTGWNIPELLRDITELFRQLIVDEEVDDEPASEPRTTVPSVSIKKLVGLDKKSSVARYIWSRVEVIHALRDHELSLRDTVPEGETIFVNKEGLETLIRPYVGTKGSHQIFSGSMTSVTGNNAAERRDRIQQVLFAQLVQLHVQLCSLAPLIRWTRNDGLPSVQADLVGMQRVQQKTLELSEGIPIINDTVTQIKDDQLTGFQSVRDLQEDNLQKFMSLENDHFQQTLAAAQVTDEKLVGIAEKVEDTHKQHMDATESLSRGVQ